MIVEVQEREVYGKVLFYPVCGNAKKFAGLTGTKTLTPKHLGFIASLGFTISYVVGVIKVWDGF